MSTLSKCTHEDTPIVKVNKWACEHVIVSNGDGFSYRGLDEFGTEDGDLIVCDKKLEVSIP